MEPKFQLKLNQIYKQIGDHAKIVLATSHQNIVSARKMSFIINDGHFYFQTDCTFRKYHDIKENNYVALCLDNIQIEGICTELGHPLSHIEFIKKFKKYFLIVKSLKVEYTLRDKFYFLLLSVITSLIAPKLANVFVASKGMNTLLASPFATSSKASKDFN